MSTVSIAAGGAAALLVLWLLARAMRGKWDLLAEHSRDLARHTVAAVLMLGTLAGTAWTFSFGRLILDGHMELIVSVGGVALAVEFGVMLCGWFLGVLDARIATARRDLLPDLLARRVNIQRWFYLTASISAIANFIFRIQQLASPTLPMIFTVLLAAFASVAPVILIILLLVILRSLPTDYRERARQTTARAMFLMTKQAGLVLEHAIKKMARGETLGRDEAQALAMATAFLRPYAPTAEIRALDYGLAPQLLGDQAQTYVTSTQLATMYQIPARTAQHWIANCPGARPRSTGRGKEAPLQMIYEGHGRPLERIAAPVMSSSSDETRVLIAATSRNNAPIDATIPQYAANEAQTVL